MRATLGLFFLPFREQVFALCSGAISPSSTHLRLIPSNAFSRTPLGRLLGSGSMSKSVNDAEEVQLDEFNPSIPRTPHEARWNTSNFSDMQNITPSNPMAYWKGTVYLSWGLMIGILTLQIIAFLITLMEVFLIGYIAYIWHDADVWVPLVIIVSVVLPTFISAIASIVGMRTFASSNAHHKLIIHGVLLALNCLSMIIFHVTLKDGLTYVDIFLGILIFLEILILALWYNFYRLRDVPEILIASRCCRTCNFSSSSANTKPFPDDA